MSDEPDDETEESPAELDSEPTPAAEDAPAAAEAEAGAAPTPDTEAAPTSGRRTTRQQAEDRRQAKLDMVQEQIDQGGLVIRQMTDEERAKYPPRPPRPGRTGRR